MLLQSDKTAKLRNQFAGRKQLKSENKDGVKKLLHATTWRSICASYERENRHRNRLGEFFLEIPARKIAVVRKQRMDAHAGLLGLNWIDVIFSLAALFANGQNAQRSYGFVRVVWCRVSHAHTHRGKIADIDDRDCYAERNQTAFDDGPG
jgi:hypothetical protein